MTLEELQAELAKQKAESAAEIERLKAHNDKVIAEKREVLEKLKAADETDAARKNAELQRELEALRKGGNTDQLEAKYQKQLADIQAEREREKAELLESATAAKKRANDMIAERDLSQAIAASGIAAPLVPAFTALMKARGLEVNTASDNPYAMIEGRKAHDFIKEYAASEDGKHFVAAPNNGGGGGPEPKTAGTTGAKPFAQMSLSERTELHKSDPAAYKAAAGTA